VIDVRSASRDTAVFKFFYLVETVKVNNKQSDCKTIRPVSFIDPSMELLFSTEVHYEDLIGH
jgi:hypothetical protein